jgi:8-oxo-dGTP pyrophosphatase MutT (NUDIX family)
VDAAALVLIRAGTAGPEVLIGRRFRQAGFLPGIHVFPGGRVDRADSAASGLAEDLHPNVSAHLRQGRRGRPALAFARAAIRETFEETGLLLVGQGELPIPGAVGPPWQAFTRRSKRPEFGDLDFICRAITPTSSARRYDTRFFLADGAFAIGTIVGNGELEDVRWWPMEELHRLTLVDVTQFVLAEALRRWRERIPVGQEPPRLYCYLGDIARWRIGGSSRWTPAPASPFRSA